MDVSARVRNWRRGFAAAAAAMLLAVLPLAPHLADSAELVRLRNALLLDEVAETRFDWTPAEVPADFRTEPGPVDPGFALRVAALDLAALSSDWERALALGRHLLANRQGPVGRPIQADLEQTYQRITRSGEGYCGDYADVFTALALAAGLEVRAWAFSFDGFGGRGHVFNEVWDGASREWRMIDVFHNLYATDEAGRPVSALAFRAAMRDGGEALRLETIEPAARPVFKYEEKAREFYLRGLDQWYLWWGNNVFAYDRAALVRVLGTVSRSLEQLGGIAQGEHPRIRVLPDAANEAEVAAMERLKRRLLACLAVLLVAFAAALVCLWGWRRARRAQAQAEAEADAPDAARTATPAPAALPVRE